MTETSVLATGHERLAFGLDWYALLDAAPASAGRRLARQRRASHMTLSGPAAASVGLAFLAGARRRARGMHSAAQAVACMHPEGTFSLTLEISPGLVWMVGVHEGAVIARTDSLHHDASLVRPLVRELAQAYPNLIELGAPHAPPAPTLAAIEAAVSSQTALTRVRPVRRHIAGACLVGGVLAAVLHGAHSSRQPVVAGDMAGGGPPLALMSDPSSALLPAVTLHGVEGLAGLLKVFYGLPVHRQGWVLGHAECLDVAGAWQCAAHYQRESESASSDAFLHAVPPSWTVDFPSLDAARVNWRAHAVAAPLHTSPVAGKADNDRHLFSHLQAVRKAFQHIDIGMSHPVAGRAGGLEVQYLRRALQFEGPLRSFSLLAPYAAGMGWNKAVLWHRSGVRPDVRHSRLVLSLSGALYETETIGSVPASEDASAAGDAAVMAPR